MNEKELREKIAESLDEAFDLLEKKDEKLIFFLFGTYPELLETGKIDCLVTSYCCPMIHKSQLVKIFADALVKLEPNLGLMLEEFYRNSAPEKPPPEDMS